MTLLSVIIVLVLLFGGGFFGYYGGRPFGGLLGFLVLLFILYPVFGGGMRTGF